MAIQYVSMRKNTLTLVQKIIGNIGEIEMNNEMIPLTIANTLDQSMKTRVEVPDTTVKQAVKHAQLAPKGNYDVYDSAGVIISNKNTRNYRDSTIYVGVPKVAGGAGIPLNRLDELASDYPSLLPVRIHTNNKYTEMVTVRLPSNGKTSSGFWKVAIHCPNANNGLPHAYILNKEEMKQGIRKASIYSGNPPSGVTYARGASRNLPGTNKPANWLCHGNVLPSLNQIGKDPIKRMNGYINHVINLLNE